LNRTTLTEIGSSIQKQYHSICPYIRVLPKLQMCQNKKSFNASIPMNLYDGLMRRIRTEMRCSYLEKWFM
jgi:hypothetical protein